MKLLQIAQLTMTKDEIRTQLIEGQKCIVIPVSEEDNINIVKR